MYFNLVLCTVAFRLSSFAVSAQVSQKAICNLQTTFQQAEKSLAGRRYDEAIQLLDRVRSCDSMSSGDSFKLGWLYGRARRFRTALQIFNGIPPEFPDAASHAYAVALSQFELADYKGSIATLKVIQVAKGLDEESANLLAVSLSKLGLYREAYAALQDQVQKGGAGIASYLNLVTVCAEGGDFQSAARIAASATQLFPASPEVFVVDGAANTLIGQLEEAYRDFSRSLQLEPDRSDAYFFLALTDYKRGQFADAITLLRRGIQHGLKDSDLHYLLAECMLQVDAADIAAALQELSLALSLNDGSVSARTLRGKLLLQTGHPTQAIVDLEFANRHDSSSRSASYNLAQAYRATGRSVEAEAIFSRLRSQPTNTLGELSDRKLNGALSEGGKQH